MRVDVIVLAILKVRVTININIKVLYQSHACRPELLQGPSVTQQLYSLTSLLSPSDS